MLAVIRLSNPVHRPSKVREFPPREDGDRHFRKAFKYPNRYERLNVEGTPQLPIGDIVHYSRILQSILHAMPALAVEIDPKTLVFRQVARDARLAGDGQHIAQWKEEFPETILDRFAEEHVA